MFLGEFQHRLDDKGRVILPSAFRERLSSGLVVTRGMDRCLDVWPRGAYEERVREMRAFPREHKRARWQKRLLTGGAYVDTPDSQGRIVIPAHLRDFAGLERELMVMGTDEKVEIWDLAHWNAELAAAEAAYADIDEPLEFR